MRLDLYGSPFKNHFCPRLWSFYQNYLLGILLHDLDCTYWLRLDQNESKQFELVQKDRVCLILSKMVQNTPKYKKMSKIVQTYPNLFKMFKILQFCPNQSKHVLNDSNLFKFGQYWLDCLTRYKEVQTWANMFKVV